MSGISDERTNRGKYSNFLSYRYSIDRSRSTLGRVQGIAISRDLKRRNKKSSIDPVNATRGPGEIRTLVSGLSAKNDPGMGHRD